MTELEKWLRRQIATDQEITDSHINDGEDPDKPRRGVVRRPESDLGDDVLIISASRMNDELRSKLWLLERLTRCDAQWADSIRRGMALPYRTRRGYRQEWAI